MARTVNFKGNPLTLAGRALKAGSVAPDFRVIAQDMKEVTLADFEGKIKVITSFPSLDTPVCDLQVKEFNKRATQVSSDVVIVGISKDLPFAQKRFCEAYNIANVKICSDYKFTSYGMNYGLLIRELNLLARSVFIVDRNNVLRYAQIVPEVTTPPDYDEALKNLEEILRNPAAARKEELPSRCTPCESGTPPLPQERVNRLMTQTPGWQLVDGKKIAREIRFKDFASAKHFLDIVSNIAEEQGHHPVLNLNYNKLTITLTTHAAGGLTENDFIMARVINELES